MKLYIDIGNTNIKVNFNIDGQEYYNNYEIKGNHSIDTFWEYLPKELKIVQITNVYITSVVPSVETIFVGLVKKYWQITPMIVEPPIKTSIKVKTDDPKSVGADLICLAAFINQKTKDGIMINMGTATTIIKVVDGNLTGVIIIPGIQTSFESLIGNSSKLSDIKLKIPTTSLGRNTIDAISIGVLQGHTNMIETLVDKIDDDSEVFISGGHSKKIVELLPNKYNFVKEATIQGLKIIGTLNE